MADTKFKLTNKKARFFIDKNGLVTKDDSVNIPTGSVLAIEVKPSTNDELSQVRVCFPPSVKVEGISLSDDKKTVKKGHQAYQAEKLLKTLWIEDLDGVEYVEKYDTVFIDCVLAKDEKDVVDVDSDTFKAIIDGFKAGRKTHNTKCPDEPPKPEPPKPADDSSDGDKSDKSGDGSGDDKSKGKPKDKPKPKKRQPREVNESATGAKLEHITQKQADLDTHATLVAIGGKEFAKHFNGLVWDESTQTYKDET